MRLTGNAVADRFLLTYPRSRKTMLRHSYMLKRLVRFAAERGYGDPANLDWGWLQPVLNAKGELVRCNPLNTGICEAYLAWLHQQGASVHTVIAARKTLGAFGAFLTDLGITPTNPADGIAPIQEPPPDMLKRFLTVEEGWKLLTAAATPTGRWCDFPERDFALVLTALIVALRPGELMTLQLTSEAGRGLVDGKTGPRYVPLPGAVRQAISGYLAHPRRACLPPSPVFYGNWGRPLVGITMRRLLRRLVARADIQSQPIWYWFRHSGATHLAWAGAQPAVLQQLLGHVDIQNTLKYVHSIAEPAMVDPLGAQLASALRATLEPESESRLAAPSRQR
jgi:site-specific recombinase XerD